MVMTYIQMSQLRDTNRQIINVLYQANIIYYPEIDNDGSTRIYPKPQEATTAWPTFMPDTTPPDDINYDPWAIATRNWREYATETPPPEATSYGPWRYTTRNWRDYPTEAPTEAPTE